MYLKLIPHVEGTKYTLEHVDVTKLAHRPFHKAMTVILQKNTCFDVAHVHATRALLYT